eukprot:7022041-Pyramimonas_sp.AAC.1
MPLEPQSPRRRLRGKQAPPQIYSEPHRAQNYDLETAIACALPISPSPDPPEAGPSVATQLGEARQNCVAAAPRPVAS